MHSPESLSGGTEFCPNCRKAVEVPEESLDLFGDLDDEDFDDDEFDDDESLADEDDDTGSEVVSTDSPMDNDRALGRRPSRLGEAIAGVCVIAVGLCLYLGGFALHIWTAYLYYTHWGTFWAIAAFIFPFFAEAGAAVFCFGWGVWFYIISIAAWVGGAVSLALLEEAGRWKVSVACSFLMVLLVGSFGYFAVGYATSPRPMTEDLQKELDDVATAVCSILNASTVAAFSPEDVKASAELIEAKVSLRKKLPSYDHAALGRIRKSVDAYLLFMRLLQEDLRDYMRRRDQGAQGEFALREATREVIEQLPSGVKPALGPMQINEVEKDLSRLLELREEGDRLPPGWEDHLKAIFDRQWRAYAEVYQDLFGCPMPPPGQLGEDAHLPGS